MRKNILLIVLVAAIFVFVGAMSNSAKAADDPVELIKNAKTPVHLHSLAGGDTCAAGSDSLVHELPTMVCTWWRSIYPPNTYPHIWHVIDERDNGIPGLNPSDKLKLQAVAKGNWIWVHVEEVTITLILKTVFPPEDTVTMYVEYTGGYDSLLYPIDNPVCTWWHEVWPIYCSYFHIDDITPGPPLECCKDILIGTQWWHVEDVAIDIEVQSIPDPTVPTMTQWGVIILAALILASAIFIMVRRRRATVSA